MLNVDTSNNEYMYTHVHIRHNHNIFYFTQTLVFNQDDQTIIQL